jgi:hypothetical protein
MIDYSIKKTKRFSKLDITVEKVDIKVECMKELKRMIFRRQKTKLIGWSNGVKLR